MGGGRVHLKLITGPYMSNYGCGILLKGTLAPSPTTRALSMFCTHWGLNPDPSTSQPSSQKGYRKIPPVHGHLSTSASDNRLSFEVLVSFIQTQCH